MPGPGMTTIGTRGEGYLDIHLNATTRWKDVPEPVWNYTLGGYQVLKKWLSYRESALLACPPRLPSHPRRSPTLHPPRPPHHRHPRFA
ncbi:MAG: type ISP restriction/modification enzyme [Roseimicrobium sp.]